MECPYCHEKRYSRDWMPSQWRGWTPETEFYHCCRQCDPECVAPARHRRVQVDEAIAAMTQRLRPISIAVRNYIGKFLQAWMNGLSYSQRKSFSHYGAIRRRSATDPVGRTTVMRTTTIATHERDFILNETNYFDPGNRVYSFAFRLLWDDLQKEHGWNEETMGDIIESILGYHYLCVEHRIEGKVGPAPRLLSNFLDDLAYNVWRVLVYSTNANLWQNDFTAFSSMLRALEPQGF